MKIWEGVSNLNVGNTQSKGYFTGIPFAGRQHFPFLILQEKTLKQHIERQRQCEFSGENTGASILRLSRHPRLEVW